MTKLKSKSESVKMQYTTHSCFTALIRHRTKLNLSVSSLVKNDDHFYCSFFCPDKKTIISVSFENEDKARLHKKEYIGSYMSTVKSENQW